MDSFAERIVEQVLADAGTIVATDVAFWGVIAFLVALCFAFAVVWFMGNVLEPVTDRSRQTWRAVMYMFFVFFPVLSATAGAGEGAIRGVERAIRTSEIGKSLLPTAIDAGVGMYAMVYSMDPGADASPTDLLSLTKMSEVRSFTEGRKPLDAERLQRHVEAFRRDGMPKLMENRETLEQMLDFFGEDYRLAHDTMTRVFDEAERAADDPEVAGPLDAMFDDMESVAAIDGDASTVTRGELEEHLTERVIIPTIMGPVKTMIRPWQIAAAIAAGVMLLVAVLVRVVNARSDGETSER